jgi:hypothetical protein
MIITNNRETFTSEKGREMLIKNTENETLILKNSQENGNRN